MTHRLFNKFVMKTIFVLSTFIIYLSSFCHCDQQYFPCYKDRCVRGLQHCVHDENERRCFQCKDIESACGTEDMPRDCDSYCIGLQLRKVENDFESLRSENLRLEDSIQRLNLSLTDTMEVDELYGEKARLIRVNNEMELESNRTVENYQRLHQNFSELNIRLDKTESDLKACKDETVTLIISLSVACAFVVIMIVCMICVYRRRRGRPYSSIRDENKEGEPMVEQHQFKGSPKMNRVPSEDSAVNMSGDRSRNDTPDASDAECEETTVIDISPIVNRRGEPTESFKTNDANVGAEPAGCEVEIDCTMINMCPEADVVVDDRGVGDNCLRKDTPAVLKGIQPTTASASQINLNQNMYS